MKVLSYLIGTPNNGILASVTCLGWVRLEANRILEAVKVLYCSDSKLSSAIQKKSFTWTTVGGVRYVICELLVISRGTWVERTALPNYRTGSGSV